MNFAQTFAQLRKKNNLTQEKIAKKLSVSRKTISNWENSRNFPDIDTLIQISSLFDISLDDLIKDKPDILNKYQQDTAMLKKSRLFFVLNYYLNIIFLSANYFGLLNFFSLKNSFLSIFMLINIFALLINSHAQNLRFKNIKYIIVMFPLSLIILFLNTFLLITFTSSKNFNIQNAFSDGQLVGIIFDVLLLTTSTLCVLILRPYTKSLLS